MSLVDFMFNSNYRDSILNPSYSTKSNIVETKEQKEERLKKFYHNYKLQSLKRQISLLENEIIYGFIDIKDINEINFQSFLTKFGADESIVNILWEEFKLKHKI